MKAEKLQPLDLADIPSDLEWCVYEEERQRGNVLCTATVYQVVLMLRWILSYTKTGYEYDYETWKVYWKTEDEYGFCTSIFLFREKVEEYDPFSDEVVIAQEPVWVKLATLVCSYGNGTVNSVALQLPEPYSKIITVDGASGIRRLIEDATHASQATHSCYPLSRNAEITSILRNDFGVVHLNYKLRCDHSQVTAIDLEIVRSDNW